jgi:high affinity sulfate transporter 1
MPLPAPVSALDPEAAAPVRPLAPSVPLARGWQRWLPGLADLRHYERSWLGQDIAAGLVLTAVLVPVGVAYAVASGLPALSGLYATILGLLAYALFGPSRVLVLGPDSSLVALVLGVVVPLSGGDPQRALALAGALALVSGSLCVLAGAGRLGFVTELLSKPIRYGYMNGIALTVLVAQLPALFGLQSQSAGLLAAVQSFGAALAAGRSNFVALALGLGTVALILLLKRWPRLPGVLIAVAGATAVSAGFDLAARADVPVLGPLPQGVPVWAFGLLQTSDLVPVLLGGLAVALVSFADTSVLSRSYGLRTGRPTDPNQEMVGLGAANLAAGLFHGFPVGASASRTPVALAAGARSQLAGVVGALSVALLLWAAPGLLRHLPNAVLAAVVIVSAAALVEIVDLRRIYRIQRWEFWLAMACFAGVAVLGAIPGIALAIAVAVVEFLWAAWRPHSAVLGRVDGVKGYHDRLRHPQARSVPGLVLFRWDAPLFFANAELFAQRALDAVVSQPASSPPVRWLVVGAEPVTRIDVTAADVLDNLDRTLRAAGVRLCFAEMKDPVKDQLKRFELFSRFGEDRFFDTLGQAVSAYLRSHMVAWQDWEVSAPTAPL